MHTQASHSHLSHTKTVFIQPLDAGGADQRAPFTSQLGLNSSPPSWDRDAPIAPADTLPHEELLCADKVRVVLNRRMQAHEIAADIHLLDAAHPIGCTLV